MKYSSEIVVNLPLKEFIKKFDNAENMKHWQRGLVSIEHISGEPGMVGAKMRLNYKIGKRKMEIIETITHSNFPYEFHGSYSAEGIVNIQENYFEEISNGNTKWTSINEFLPLKFMMRVMLWMMPKAFKKQTTLYLKDFKNFAEKGVSVTNAKT
jgi:hypothetical protein